jgi:integrase
MLTVKRIERLRAAGVPGKFSDRGSQDGKKGLYLFVKSKTSAHFVLRYQIEGRSRAMGLGSVEDINLAEARDLVDAARELLKKGLDPLNARYAERAEKKAKEIAEKVAAAGRATFKEVADAYVRKHSPGWRSREHERQWRSSMAAYVYPTLGSLPIDSISTNLVLQCIEPHWERATESMSRVRGRIENVLDYAIARDMRRGDNPARLAIIQHALPAREKISKKQHFAALPFAELPAFMADLRKVEGCAARALQVLVLTAARTGEIREATWDEIDLENALWSIPAGKMKAGIAHTVPLSAHVVELLRKLPREQGNPRVFLSAKRGAALGDAALRRVLGTLRSGVSVHGFRSVFMDWAHETTNYPKVVIDMALAHKIKDPTEASYRRGDLLAKRRKLMEAYTRFALSPPVGGQGQNVVRLRS